MASKRRPLKEDDPEYRRNWGKRRPLVQAYLFPQEFKDVRKAAAEHFLPVSNFIRSVLVRYMRGDLIPKPEADKIPPRG